jgi:hypothetical protein
MAAVPRMLLAYLPSKVAFVLIDQILCPATSLSAVVGGGTLSTQLPLHGGSGRSTQGTVGGPNASRHRRCRRRRKPPREITIAVTPVYTDIAATYSVAHCALGMDPLLISLCMDIGPPA